MRIVFDLDNTLIEERGIKVRPGAVKLLKRLKSENHTLIIWTNSVRERAIDILKHLRLEEYFSKIITREDYDLEAKDGWKDIRQVKGDVIIDDNPEQERYAKIYGYKAIIVKPFSSFRSVSAEEFESIPKKLNISNNKGFFSKLFG